MIADLAALRAELERHGLRDPKLAYVVAQTDTEGYCPFVAGGRQYVTTRFKHTPGYAIRDITEEGATDGE